MLCSQLGPSAWLSAVTFAVTLAVRSPVTFLTDGISLCERDGAPRGRIEGNKAMDGTVKLVNFAGVPVESRR